MALGCNRNDDATISTNGGFTADGYWEPPLEEPLRGGFVDLLRQINDWSESHTGFACGENANCLAVPEWATLRGVPRSVGAAQVWSRKARLHAAQLPTSGRIRYVPPHGYHPSMPLPRGSNKGYIDRFGNEWVPGPSRTAGQAFEWDIQLSRTGRHQLGWLSRDGRHVNVSLDGEVTH